MNNKKKILFHLGHPAHFHLFRNVIKRLTENNHSVRITIKKKDVLENLLNEEGLSYHYLMKKERGDGVLNIGTGLLRRNYKLYELIKYDRPDIMLGTSAEIAHIGSLLGITNLNFNEDDYDVIPIFSYLTYPFSSLLLSPSCCNVGPWKKKTFFYDSYHELAYLHPRYFSPKKHYADQLSNNRKYFIMRFANLNAHHDFGKKGITLKVAKKVISILKNHGDIYITSERELEPELEKYRIRICPSKIHHVLSYAEMLIADSQTMTAESAVLGTPSIRFNDFVGKIGYLEELEKKYKLTYGFKTSEQNDLLDKVSDLAMQNDLKATWEKRKNIMLKDKIDITALILWVIDNYPDSIKDILKTPGIQEYFRFERNS